MNDINFIDVDAAAIEAKAIADYEAAYEAATGEALNLSPADPRRLHLLSLVSQIIQLKNEINFTGKMNLLAYAQGDYLDHLGMMLGVSRMPAAAAVTTIEYVVSTALPSPELIPAGTRFTPDGKTYFATIATHAVSAGETKTEFMVKCLETGEVGNGFMPGQICKLVDPLPWVQSVSNITTSEGGADTETDEHLRERIRLAPEAFSVAGSYGAYKFWAMSAHQSIIDVAVVGPSDSETVNPGEVYIYPLLVGGEIPGIEIQDLVFSTLDAEKVRPLTDQVFVQAPEVVPYHLKIKYYLLKTALDASATKAAAENVVKAWVTWQSSAIGRDINTDYLIYLLRAAGVHRSEISSPVFTVLEKWQLAVLEGDAVIEFGGLEDG